MLGCDIEQYCNKILFGGCFLVLNIIYIEKSLEQYLLKA